MPENAPKFIMDFSKERDKEGRHETAKLVLEKRAEGREKINQKKEIEARIEELSAKLSDLDSGWISRFRNKGEILKVRTELGGLNQPDDDEEKKEGEDEFDQARDILTGYYEKQKKEWRETGYDENDVKKYFTEENLEKLDLDSYALLLSRFPSEMATHVTRQGIRDHSSMTEHRAGVGDYSNGFTNILEDGRLRSLVSKFLSKEQKEQAIEEYFKWLVGQIRILCPWVKDSDRDLIQMEINGLKAGADDCRNNIDWIASYRMMGSYGNSSALHLAKNAVMDSCYGGEFNNEVFFTYPIGHFYSEHQFTDTGEGLDKNNDLWLWTKENKGLSVDAALVFLPKSTMVDKKTGSKYKLDENQKPTVGNDRVSQLEKYLLDPEFIIFLKEFYLTLESISKKDDSETERYKAITETTKALDIKFGISDKTIIETIVVSSRNFQFRSYLNYGPGGFDRRREKEYAEELLSDVGAYYLATEDPIPAEEYWESFFANNPDLRPSKIVYYDGTPTKALDSWLYKNKAKNYLKKRFSETYESSMADVSWERSRRNAAFFQYEEYIDLCENILDKTFPAKSEEEPLTYSSKTQETHE